MKKYIINFLLMSLLISSLTGCGVFSKKEDTNKDEINIQTEDVKEIISLLNEEKKITDEDINLYLEENSDITNITNKEKQDMGLLPFNNSDTDNDGLTDKEEIEIYHTDPLKSSTSGDFYTDFYKINNNMDINKHYDMDTYEFKYNECEEISLTPIDANDLDTFISDVTGYHYSENNAIFKEYRITGFKGKLELDKIENSDIVVLSTTDEIAEEIEINKLGNSFKLNFKNAQNSVYYIIIYNKGSLLDFFNDKIFCNATLNDITLNSENTSTETTTSEEITTTKNEYMIIISPFLNELGENLFVAFSTGKTNNENDIYYVKNVVNSVFDDALSLENPPQIINVDNLEFNLIYTVFSKLIPWAELSNQIGTEEGVLQAMFLTYFKTGESVEETMKLYFPTIDDGIIEEALKYKPKSEKFDLYYDTFPFNNFGSYISPGGNCAGMSLVTAQLFNGNELELKGSVDTNLGETNYKIEWDLTPFERSQTFYDRGLVDYDMDSSTFGKKKEELDDETLNIVNYLGAMWIKANQFSGSDPKVFGSNYNYSMIENLIEYLNQNKIALLSFTSVKTAHTINVYDYYHDANNKNVLYLKLYDNNFPFNETESNGKIYKTNLVMKIEKIQHIDDTKSTFEFSYVPFSEYGYIYEFSSRYKPSLDGDNGGLKFLSALSAYSLSFNDEDGNLITE